MSKKLSVRCTKNNRVQKRKTVMQKLGSYTLMFAVRACNVGRASTSPTLKPANKLTHTATGFTISNAATDSRNGRQYARWVHEGHGGPIPYAGNPWMRRGFEAAKKLLGVKGAQSKEN